jgi:protein-tyrosine-phosphatase
VSRDKTILLVCTGNSCRSVMAGGLLKKLLKEKGSYKIITAGTRAFEGAQPTFETIELMFQEGIDMSTHRSSPLSDEMLKEADLILVMERRHREDILGRLPGLKDKVHLLSEFGRQESEDKLVDPDITDPIGMPLEFYRNVLGIIKESLARTVKKLEEA